MAESQDQTSTTESNDKYRIVANRWQHYLDMYADRFPRDVPVLILGQTGTGKELIARNLHHRLHGNWGDDGNKPFVAINCAHMNNELMESGLFGYKKGAFTGAMQDRPGAFQRAKKGTLFLDEIQELSPPAQGGLLRAIAERKVQRVGSVDEEDVNCTIALATSADPTDDLIFRQDLYYRIKEFTIPLSPLWDRGEDVLILTRYFIERLNKETVPGIEPKIKAIDGKMVFFMMTWRWPGNVRELEKLVTFACRSSGNETVTMKSILSKESREKQAAVVTPNYKGPRFRSFNIRKRPSNYDEQDNLTFAISYDRTEDLKRIIPLREEDHAIDGIQEIIKVGPATVEYEEPDSVATVVTSSDVDLNQLPICTREEAESLKNKQRESELKKLEEWSVKIKDAHMLVESYFESQKKQEASEKAKLSVESESCTEELLRLDHDPAMKAFEKEYLKRWLDAFDGNVAKAASSCGMKRETFRDHARKLGLK